MQKKRPSSISGNKNECTAESTSLFLFLTLSVSKPNKVYKHGDCKFQCYKPASQYCHLSNKKASVCQDDGGVLTAECCGHVN